MAMRTPGVKTEVIKIEDDEMTKEFNAETCTIEEATIASFEYEIENAETDADKKRVAGYIKDAVRDKHIGADDANKLLAKLGVEVESSPRNDKTANEDRLAWEEEQKSLSIKLKDAEGEVERLKEELKAAKDVVAQLQITILGMADHGSKGFKSGRLF